MNHMIKLGFDLNLGNEMLGKGRCGKGEKKNNLSEKKKEIQN